MTRALTPDTIVYDLANAGDPQVSPDGRSVLYTLAQVDHTTRKPTSQLWRCAIDGGEPRQLTYAGQRNGSGRWSPDGAQIAFISDRAGVSGIFVLPADGGEAQELTRHNTPIADLAWSPDGSHIAYTALYDPENPDEENPSPDEAARVRVIRRMDYKQDNRGFLNDQRSHVFLLDVAQRTRIRLTSEPTDYQYPQWSPDGTTIAALAVYQHGWTSRLALITVATSETRLVGLEQGIVVSWAWSPDGKRILYVGDTRQTYQTDFFLLDLASDTVRRLTDDLQCLPDAGFTTIAPPAAPVWLDETHALFHALRAGASGLYTIDTTNGEIGEVACWDAVNQGLSADAARCYFVQSHASLSTVGAISVYDRATGETCVIADGNAALFAEAPMAQWERLDVTRGGYTTEAWLLKPPAFDPAKRYPVVLDVHGGPNGSYGYSFNPVQQALAAGGMLVVYANPRGSSSYGRDFTQQVLGDWGGEDYQDLMAVVDVVLQRTYADAERLGIFGYSYGGYMTAWTIGHTDRFAAAVCGAPCFDLAAMFGTSDIGYVFCREHYTGAPHEQPDWYRTHSPSTYIHQARTPTLLLHGEADDRCPIGQSEAMFTALKDAGCEVEYVRYPGGSHLFLRNGPPAHRADFYQRVLAWFTAHLGGEG